jgi:hypothetical protein
MDRLLLPCVMRLLSNDTASGRNQIVVSIRDLEMAVSGKQYLAGGDFRFDFRKVIRKTNALGAALLWLGAAAADHEWHLAIVDNGSKRPSMKIPTALPLSSVTIDPQARDNAE